MNFVVREIGERNLVTKGRRVGMADEADSKSVVGNNVRVQVPLPAVLKIAWNPVKSWI